MDDGWVALFSGGKDSSLALHMALERGLSVDQLVTVHPPEDSYLYHVPATGLAGLAAESIGLPLEEITLDGPLPDDDSEQRAAVELEPLEEALTGMGDIAGLIAGAIESEYQAGRLEAMCDRLGCDLYAPLWRASPETVTGSLLDGGFDVLLVAVAAAGLDGTWLGRRLDEVAVAELQDLSERYGVHPLGEGGEYETIVLDGPHMASAIEAEFERHWDGTRGRLELLDAHLAD